jgi:large subunit ribosomal protein L27
MAHKKSAGTTKNGRDSNPKYLGIKLVHGSSVKVGGVIIRQRGTDILPGKNVGIGHDHTLFALKDGTVELGYKRKIHFNNKSVQKKIVRVV